jgi:hypothetical protein
MLCLCVLLSLCCDYNPVSSGDPGRLTSLDNGRTVSYSQGDTFLVALRAVTPSWRVVDCDSSVVQYDGGYTFVPDDPSHPKGTPGTYEYPFTAVGAGVTVLRMQSGSPVPIDSFEITITVQERTAIGAR